MNCFFEIFQFLLFPFFFFFLIIGRFSFDYLLCIFKTIQEMIFTLPIGRTKSAE